MDRVHERRFSAVVLVPFLAPSTLALPLRRFREQAFLSPRKEGQTRSKRGPSETRTTPTRNRGERKRSELPTPSSATTVNPRRTTSSEYVEDGDVPEIL